MRLSRELSLSLSLCCSAAFFAHMLAMMSKLPAMQPVHLEVKKRNVLMIIIIFCIIVVLTITIHLQTTLTLFKLVIVIKSLYK